jgi:hypothetical protein
VLIMLDHVSVVARSCAGFLIVLAGVVLGWPRIQHRRQRKTAQLLERLVAEPNRTKGPQ